MKKNNNRKLAKRPAAKQRNAETIPPTIKQSIGFPDTMRTHLRYEDTITLSGAAQQYTFRGNSLFDPDFTSTGHQPMYFDQFISIYEKYRVYGSSIKITVNNNVAAGGSPCEAVLAPVSSIPTFTSSSMAKEVARAKFTGLVPAGGFRIGRSSNAITTVTMLGLRGPQIYDADYAAVFSANPVQLWYWALYFYPASTGGTLNVSFTVEIIFDCEFYDRQPLSLS